MGSGTDPDVIAELPIIEVVAAVMLWAGEGRHFVVLKASRYREFVNGRPYIPEHLFVGQGGRVRREGRIGLYRQLVNRQVCR